jgi:ribosome biogenesis GTPase / thiamine phosphate phosphatase
MKGRQAPRGGSSTGPAPQGGLVVAAHGRHCLVECEDGRRLRCHPRGKRNETVVGDHVRWAPSGDEGSIEAVDERRNLLFRQDEWRTKSFAANLDLVLLLLAAEPDFSDAQLTRALIAAQAQAVPVLIVLNKRDLVEPHARAWARLAPYRAMGYEMMGLSLRGNPDRGDLSLLLTRLHGRITLVLGPSGVGKSSLINRLVPGADLQTGEISHALNSGRHTTTSTTLHWVDRADRTGLIDSPGFQAFGLHHVEPMQLAQLMPDLRPFAGQCRFYNCTHRKEPGCAVLAAIREGGDGGIDPRRHSLYGEIFDELSAPPRY